MNTKMSKLALAIGALVMAGGAWATNDSATFDSTAAVASQCVVGNTSAMDFGTLVMLDATTGGLDTGKANGTGGFDATCTNGTALQTLKFASLNGGGSAFKMKTGSGGLNELIAYTLYEGAADTGTAIAHNTLAAFTGFDADGTVKSLQVTGKVLPAAKNSAKVGSYSDTVTITVGYTP